MRLAMSFQLETTSGNSDTGIGGRVKNLRARTWQKEHEGCSQSRCLLSLGCQRIWEIQSRGRLLASQAAFRGHERKRRERKRKERGRRRGEEEEREEGREEEEENGKIIEELKYQFILVYFEYSSAKCKFIVQICRPNLSIIFQF